MLQRAAALTGAAGLALLAVTHHSHHGETDVAFALMAAIALMSAAAASLAVAGGGGRANAIGGGLMLTGANTFAGVLYASVWVGDHPFHMLAPLGGAAMIAGWLVLALAKTA